MTIPDRNNLEPELEWAVVQRLGRLGTMPVDTSRLERMVQQQIPRPADSPSPARWFRLAGLRSMRSVAAGILVLVLIGALLWGTSGGPAQASTAEMVQLHRDLVSGRVPVMKVDSIQQASKVLADAWPEQPGLPRAPASHVMACCMQSIKDRKVACVLFNDDGQPVTMSVARSSELRSPQSPTMVRDGQAFHVESAGRLNMVSTQREGRWICLIGQLPVDRLVEIARGLQFE